MIDQHFASVLRTVCRLIVAILVAGIALTAMGVPLPIPAALIGWRPVDSMTALLIVAGLGIAAAVVVIRIALSRSPLTWAQHRRLSRMRLDAAMRGEHWQEDIRMRDEVLGEEHRLRWRRETEEHDSL